MGGANGGPVGTRNSTETFLAFCTLYHALTGSPAEVRGRGKSSLEGESNIGVHAGSRPRIEEFTSSRVSPPPLVSAAAAAAHFSPSGSPRPHQWLQRARPPARPSCPAVVTARMQACVRARSFSDHPLAVPVVTLPPAAEELHTHTHTHTPSPSPPPSSSPSP